MHTITEKEAIEYLKSHKKGIQAGGLNDQYTDKAIQALVNQERIIKLLRCHDNYSRNVPEINYELVKAVRCILEIDERPMTNADCILSMSAKEEQYEY